MDKTNFTGLRNIGGYSGSLPYLIKDNHRTHLLVNLTDDFKGRDLSEFKNVMKKCESEIGKCMFPKDNNFIHIMTSVFTDIKDIPELAVNYTVIKPTTKTLPIFDYIAKLTKRIAKMSDKDFDIRECFKYGPDGNEYIIPNINVTDLVEAGNVEQQAKLLDKIYSPETARKTASKINKHIQFQMNDYFQVQI